MTVGEAINRGVKFIRKPVWNPYAKLELVKTPDGTQGPWTKLHDIDPDGQAEDGRVPIGTTDILLFQADDGRDDWEECCGLPGTTAQTPVDERSSERRARDEQIATEPQLAPPVLPPDALSSPMETKHPASL